MLNGTATDADADTFMNGLATSMASLGVDISKYYSGKKLDVS